MCSRFSNISNFAFSDEVEELLEPGLPVLESSPLLLFSSTESLLEEFKIKTKWEELFERVESLLSNLLMYEAPKAFEPWGELLLEVGLLLNNVESVVEAPATCGGDDASVGRSSLGR